MLEEETISASRVAHASSGINRSISSTPTSTGDCSGPKNRRARNPVFLSISSARSRVLETISAAASSSISTPAMSNVPISRFETTLSGSVLAVRTTETNCDDKASMNLLTLRPKLVVASSADRKGRDAPSSQNSPRLSTRLRSKRFGTTPVTYCTLDLILLAVSLSTIAAIQLVIRRCFLVVRQSRSNHHFQIGEGWSISILGHHESPMSRGRVIQFLAHGPYDLEPCRWVWQLPNSTVTAKTGFRVKEMVQPFRQQILVRSRPAITICCASKQNCFRTRMDSKCPDLGKFKKNLALSCIIQL